MDGRAGAGPSPRRPSRTRRSRDGDARGAASAPPGGPSPWDEPAAPPLRRPRGSPSRAAPRARMPSEMIAIVRAARRFRRTTLLRRVFCALRCAVRRCLADRRQRLNRHAGRRRQRTLLRSFSAWQGLCFRRREGSEELLRRVRHRESARLFKAWRRHVRSHRRRLAEMGARRHWRTLASCFDAWQRFCRLESAERTRIRCEEDLRRDRRGLHRAAAHDVRRRLRLAWTGWHRYHLAEGAALRDARLSEARRRKVSTLLTRLRREKEASAADADAEGRAGSRAEAPAPPAAAAPAALPARAAPVPPHDPARDPAAPSGAPGSAPLPAPAAPRPRRDSFVDKMASRAAERRRRRAELAERQRENVLRRRLEEEARLARAAEAAAAERQREEAAAAAERERRREQWRLAALHRQRGLLLYRGLRPWKALVALARLRAAKADAFRRDRIAAGALRRWAEGAARRAAAREWTAEGFHSLFRKRSALRALLRRQRSLRARARAVAAERRHRAAGAAFDAFFAAAARRVAARRGAAEGARAAVRRSALRAAMRAWGDALAARRERRELEGRTRRRMAQVRHWMAEAEAAPPGGAGAGGGAPGAEGAGAGEGAPGAGGAGRRKSSLQEVYRDVRRTVFTDH